MSETACPNCGEKKERLAGHWRTCGYPMPSVHQRAVLRGLMLAGANVSGNGNNKHLSIGTANQRLAEWAADQLSWLCQSILEVGDPEDGETAYRVKTTAHPQINHFGRWEKLPARSGRKPPDDIVLERTTGRVWWAFSGGLQWPGPYDSYRVARFSAKREERAEGILKVLENAGYNPYRVEGFVQVPPEDTSRWQAWLGDPVPGVIHKWQSSIVKYFTIRAEPETQIEYETTLCKQALKIAQKRVEQNSLTPEQFENCVSEVSAEEVAEVLGGGSWESALNVVGPLETEEAGEYSSGRGPSHAYSESETMDVLKTVVESSPTDNPWKKWSEDRINDAVRRALEDLGQPLSSDKYRRWAREHHAPAIGLICYDEQAPYDSWPEAKQAALDDETAQRSSQN